MITIAPPDVRTYGLDPIRNYRLIAKLRNMPAEMRDNILTPAEEGKTK